MFPLPNGKAHQPMPWHQEYFFWRPEVVFLEKSLDCSPMKQRFSLDFVAHGMLHWVGIKFFIERVQWDTGFLTLIKSVNQFCWWQCQHCHCTKVVVSNQTFIFWVTCRKRANASHGKNSSFKSQEINFFNLFVTITSKIIAHLMFILLSN